MKYRCLVGEASTARLRCIIQYCIPLKQEQRKAYKPSLHRGRVHPESASSRVISMQGAWVTERCGAVWCALEGVRARAGARARVRVRTSAASGGEGWEEGLLVKDLLQCALSTRHIYTGCIIAKGGGRDELLSTGRASPMRSSGGQWSVRSGGDVGGVEREEWDVHWHRHRDCQGTSGAGGCLCRCSLGG